MMLLVTIFITFVGVTTIESATYPCQSKISTNGYGQIQSPDFPAVKTTYTCRNFFYYPRPKGAVILNITDISLYYYKDDRKVCSGALEIGTYKAPCLEAKPFCIVYFNDMKCIQQVVVKHRKCLWYQSDKRSVDTVIKSDGLLGNEDTNNGTSMLSWSYPKGVRMTYEFVDCPQDPTSTKAVPLTPRTTISPGAIVEKTVSTTTPPRWTTAIFPTWMVSSVIPSTTTTSRWSTNATVASAPQERQNRTTTQKQSFKSAGSLTFPEIIIMSVSLFVVLVVLTIVIVLIIVKAKGRKKSWNARLPSILGRDYRISGAVPPSGRTNAT